MSFVWYPPFSVSYERNQFSLLSSDLILFCVEAMLAVVDPLRGPALGAEGGRDPVQALGIDPVVQVADTT